jgi:hypothetical protein
VKRGHLVGIVVAIVAAVVVIWVVAHERGRSSTAAAGSNAASGSVAGATGSTGSGSGAAGSDSADDDGETDSRYRVIDADARLALLNRIAAAREARQAGKPAPATAAPSAEDPPALDGILTTDQILDGIMPLMPLFKECYQGGLDRRTIAAGKVTFKMHLVGEPDIGTLVDHATLEGDPAFLADAELSTCLHETMMSIELPPMSQGAEIDVTTAMQFSPDGEPPE